MFKYGSCEVVKGLNFPITHHLNDPDEKVGANINGTADS